MSIGFELTITIIGVSVMLFSLSIMILASELLKRLFKGEDDRSVYETPLKIEELREEAIITAALMAYLGDTPQKQQRRTPVKNSDSQPPTWNMASRMELMGLKSWRER